LSRSLSSTLKKFSKDAITWSSEIFEGDEHEHIPINAVNNIIFFIFSFL
jgi:hypothetical protein